MIRWAQAQAPVADFSANVVSGCAPLAVTFKDNSSGNPTFWNWDFGGGNLSNLQNPTMVFSTPGTYSVTLVVRNGDGTHGVTKTNYITVNPSPQARFTADKTIGCLPSTIRFTDQSSPMAGTLVSWFWDFGDGTTSTDQHPVHQYTSTGFYTVLLRVKSSTGCENATAMGRYIRIVAGVIPDFSFNIPTTCRGPFAINFTNLTSGPGDMTYQWNFGNSTGSTDESPAATYAAAGTYTVTLNATSEYGCVGSIQRSIDITGTGTSFNSPDTVCINTPVTFQNASTTPPVSTTWDYGNGSQSNDLDGSTTYTAAGTYPVKLTNVYPTCTDSLTKPIVVVDKPVVSFTAPVTTSCKAPLTVNFQSTAPDAVDWQWDFGDGTTGTGSAPSHTYTTEGEFDVTLSVTTRHGCANSLTQANFVRIVKPTVSFSNAPTGGCAPFDFIPTANFNSLTTVINYFWEYGDGFTATTTVPTGPSHRYNTAGSFTIKVTITTVGGCTASQELVNGVRTGLRPVSNFTLTPADACASDAISFTFLNPAGPPPVDEYLWNFGDGTTSTDRDPTHVYTDSGYFNVTVTAYNNKCPVVSAPQRVHIKPPIARFKLQVACPNVRLVNITNESKVDPMESTTYLWDFGDGTTSNAANPGSHMYTSLGPKTVKLTLTTATCTHTYSQQLELVSAQADFTVSKTPVCKGEMVTLTAVGNNPANVYLHQWAIGSGARFLIGQQTKDSSFDTNGTYPVSLRITDINGCIDIKTVNDAIVVAGPVANFTPVQRGGCANSTITFNDGSTSAASIKSWTFDFGDGNTQTFVTAPFTHTYADTGRFVVKMTVTDLNDCSDTYTSLDTVVISKPVAGFISDYTTICPKTDLPFKDTSSGNGLTWRWDFGDGGTSTDQSPVYRYTAISGTYSVQLVITDEFGCTDTATKTDLITVKKPVPAFTARDTSSICTLLETKFTFEGSDHESFFWDFGDGDISTLPNPNHFYNNYGSYVAKLYVVGYGGCLDSLSDTINVYNPYTISDIAYSPLTNCNSLNVNFTVVTPPATNFIFNYGDGGLDSSQVKIFQHFYKEPGFFAPSMLLRDSLGCQVNIGGPNTIRVIGALPLFGVDKKNFCDQGTVNFTNYTVGNDPVITRIWDFGDGTTSSDTDPTHTFAQPGTFVVKQTVTTQTGCTNTITDTVRVYVTPEPLIEGDTVVCINNTLALRGNLVVPDTAISWTWDLGSNGPSTDQNVSVTYPQTGTYPISLEAANKLGCKNKTSKNIYVPPTPVITVRGNTTIPVGTGVNLPVTYSDNVVNWAWTPSNGLSCTDCPTPFANPKFTTQYYVRVRDEYGCTATQGITVTVICNSENYFVPNTFSPNNDGQNDVFLPRGRNIARISRMQVFSRWGELVFDKKDFMANDASAGWDGTYKGKPAVADVYVYVIEFVCENAAIVPFRGNVTLIR